MIRTLLFLRETPDVGIQFTGKSLDIFGYSDADWAGDLDSRRSTTGYVVYAAGGPIAWQSRLQTTVAVSTMEAEYMSAFGAIQELIWIKGVLSEIGSTVIFGDQYETRYIVYSGSISSLQSVSEL